uniref:Copia protein n=1 Tax=Tanacetum cinerariifolium TaxID=118510 RepID=A0A699PXI0_TANCI|nr:copia protein [Tanacetum cinerariifolium]
MGKLTFFLGLQVQQNDGIFISQDKYVAEILKKFRFTEVKNASTPIETQKPLLKDKDGEELDVHMYRYQVNPKVSHFHVVKRIFRYLKGQPKLGLWYPKDSPFDLVAYTDSDYARASLDKKPTTGGKKDERGIMIRNKARLVSQGHTQEEGIDYDEVFTPVARIKAIRLFLAYASFKDFVAYQMDVKSAFLYGKIKEEVYVCKPAGLEEPEFPDTLYKVKKALYGLH